MLSQSNHVCININGEGIKVKEMFPLSSRVWRSSSIVPCFVMKDTSGLQVDLRAWGKNNVLWNIDFSVFCRNQLAFNYDPFPLPPVACSHKDGVYAFAQTA